MPDLISQRSGLFPWLLTAWLFLAASAAAQDVTIASIPTDGSATVDQLDAVIERYASRDDLDEEIRTAIVDRLQEARSQVTALAAAEAAAEEYAAALESAPAETDRLRAALEEVAQTTVTPEDLDIDELTPLSELEQRLTREQAALAAAEAELARLETQIVSEEARPAAARERISELRGSRDELSAAATAEAAPGRSARAAEAARLSASLRLTAQSAEIRRLEQELLSQAVRVNLLNAQRDTAARTVLETERRVDVIREEANRARQSSALLSQQAAAAAELAAADKHPVVRELAEGNASLTSELPSLVTDIETVSSQLDEVNAARRELEERLARSRQRVEIGGLSRAIGELLEEERRNLPQVAFYRGAVRQRSSLLAEIGVSQLKIQEQRRGLSPLESAVERAMEGIGEEVPADEAGQIRDEVRLLLRDRRNLLEQAEGTYSTYLQVLADLDAAQRQLVSIATDYQDFLREHQIWIPSAPVFGLGEWKDIVPAILWAVSAESWRDTFATLVRSLGLNLSTSIGAVMILLVLFLAQRPLQRKYREMSERVGRLSTDSIWLTLGSLAIAAVRALPIPVLIGSAGWFLSHAELVSPFTLAVSMALGALAPFLYNLLVFRILAAKDGVLELHFHWQASSLAVIRRQLDRLLTLGAPLILATVFFYLSDYAEDRATLGRLFFIFLMVLLSSVIHPLVHPRKGVVRHYYESRPDYWVTKLRWLWYVIGALGPVVLAFLSVLGYLYTSMITDQYCSINTIWLALVNDPGQHGRAAMAGARQPEACAQTAPRGTRGPSGGARGRRGPRGR